MTIKNVFASTAETNIPNPPVPGQSYRNTNLTSEEVGEGWPFKEIVDSAKFNEAMYEYTTICQQLEKYGFLPWSANTDYPAGGCALGTNGNVYQAKQATGPSTTSVDPVTDTSHRYWDLFYYATVTANRALVSNGNGKVSASSTTATELGYVHGVTSAIQTQLNNKANNNAVVHIAGTEDITGRKTFTDRVYAYADVVYINNVTKGTAPSSVQYGNIYMVDSTKSWGDLYALGRFVTSVNVDSSVVSQIQAYKNEANSNIFGYIRVTYDTANNQYFASIGGSSSGTNWSLTRETNNTTVQTIPTMGWVNNPATSTNVVHRSGNEIIGGEKTFSSQAIFEKANGIQLKGTNHYYTLRSIGSTPEGCALLLDNSSSSIAFYATDNRITIGSTAIPAYAPTPSDSYSTTSGTQIATTGWVGSNFVNVAGTQTITGEKTFTKGVTVHKSDPRVWLENDDAIKGTAPSSNLVSAYQFRDKNHELLGSVHSQYQTDKKIITQLLAYKANSASDTASVRMGVGYNYAGKEITFAPACDDYDSIVTTIGNSKAKNGFFKLGNGLIIQWGRVSNTNNSNITLTFPTPFTSTNYSINAMRTSITSGGYSYDGITGVSSRATTSCVLYSFYGNSSYDWIAIGY